MDVWEGATSHFVIIVTLCNKFCMLFVIPITLYNSFMLHFMISILKFVKLSLFVTLCNNLHCTQNEVFH